MIETALLKTIVTVLFAAAIVWVVWLLIRQDSDTLPRALILTLLFGLGLLFLHNTKLETLSWNSVRQEFFPSKKPIFKYESKEGVSGGRRYIRYFFIDPGPAIKVSLEPNGKSFHLKDVEPVNSILSVLGLPEVPSGAQELNILTGRSEDINNYRWEDYPRGPLELELGLCRDKTNLTTYTCLVSITIYSKY